MNQDLIWQGLKQVIDPELGINMVDLGLVYQVETKQDTIHITMTLTTPGCPLGGYFIEEVERQVSTATGKETDNINVQIVFDPPWTQDMMNEEAIAELGID